jgi:hypothetical protein
MLLDGKKLNHLVMKEIPAFLAEVDEIADLLIFFLYCKRQRFPQRATVKVGRAFLKTVPSRSEYSNVVS